MLELEGLDADRVHRVGVEIRQGLEFGHPGTEHLVGECHGALEVQDVDDHVGAEVEQRHRGVAVDVVDAVGEVHELRIVREAGLQRDRFVFRAAGELAYMAGVAGVAPVHHLGGFLQCRHLGKAGYGLAVDHHLELERAVGIVAVGVRRKQRSCHRYSPRLLLRDLLLDAHDDEFRRLQRRETDEDDHPPGVDVALGHRVPETAAHEVGVGGLLALEGTGAMQPVHEGLDVQAQRRPEPMIVGLEHRPLDALEDALLDHHRRAADRNVAPFRIGLGRERSRAPDHRFAQDGPVAVDTHRVEAVLLVVADLVFGPGGPNEAGGEPRGRFPDAAAAIGPGPDACGKARGRHEVGGLQVRPAGIRVRIVVRVHRFDPGIVERGIGRGRQSERPDVVLGDQFLA